MSTYDCCHEFLPRVMSPVLIRGHVLRGFSITSNSIWGASSAVKSFVLPKQQKQRRQKSEESLSLLSAIPEEALALLFDVTVSHQAI